MLIVNMEYDYNCKISSIADDEIITTIIDDEINIEDEIGLIREMYNEESKTMTYCNPNQYKYIKLIIEDLKKSNLNLYRKKTSSKDIENDYLKWMTSCWITKKDKCWFWKKKMRIQIINSQIYLSSTKYEMEEHIYDKEGYRIGLFFYLAELQRKYSKYLPNTDFILYYHDFKKGTKNMEDRYNWKYNDKIPYFFSDYNLAHSLTDNLLLMTISRSYLKYKYFAEKEKAQKKFFNQYNVRRIADYNIWLKLLKELNETNNLNLLNWDYKTINKALFRGANNSRFRNKINEKLSNKNDILYPLLNLSEYFDIAITNYYALFGKDGDLNKKNYTLSIKQQLKYRFMIVLDGISVRDALIYQMKMGCIILKQLTTNYEWWYFDIINNYHWILFENISHLISIVINLVNQIHGYYKSQKLNDVLFQNEFKYLLNHSMTSFNYNKLKKITENSKKFINEYLNKTNVDCFFIHMLQIYNYYLFDTKSINKSLDQYMRPLPINIY